MSQQEKRTYYENEDGSKYVLTESFEEHWQKSHRHQFCTETYIVQEGSMTLAFLEKDELVLQKFGPGQVHTFRPGEAHNVLLPVGARIHTVKHGEVRENDWIENKELDQLIKTATASGKVNTKDYREGSISSLERYKVYYEHYRHLDNLIWKGPLFLIGILSIVGTILTDKVSNIAVDERRMVEFGILFCSAVILWVGSYSLERMSKHHRLLDQQLSALEGAGYFAARTSKSNGVSAQKRWQQLLKFLSVVLLVIAIITLYKVIRMS